MSVWKNDHSGKTLPEAAGSDAVCIHRAVDAATRFINDGFAHLTGYQLVDVVAVPPVDLPLWSNKSDARRFADTLREAPPRFSMQTGFRCRDGRLISVRLRSERMSYAAEPQYLTTVTCITRHEQVPLKIINHEAFEEILAEIPSTLLESSPAFLVIINPDGSTMMMNRTLLDALGYSREEIELADYLDTFVPAEQRGTLTRRFNAIRENLVSSSGRDGILTRSGRELSVEWQEKPIIGEEGQLRFIFRVGIDISEKVLLENQLRRSQHLEAIGTLSSGIAHDFNNILTPIIIHSEMAQSKGPGDDSYTTHIAKVLKGARRAKRLVRQILAFARQSEQKQQPFHLELIVKEGLKLLRATLPATIAIRQSIPSDLGMILGEPSQINQAFMNLCTNAKHAMEASGGMLSVEMGERVVGDGRGEKIPGIAPGRYLELSVSDTGEGIDPQDMERIFEPYYTTRGTGDGTGLGLAMVHGIVNRHSGTVTVESARDKGTVFRLFFPLIPPAAAATPSTGESTPGGSESLLFVDDEEATVIAMQEMLSDLGYTVYATQSSHDALEVFRRTPDRFDLVITDQTMPEMTGARLAAEMMALRPGLPIILCTGYSDRVTREEAYRMGIREYVMKPLEMLEIATTIRNVLDQWQRKDPEDAHG